MTDLMDPPRPPAPPAAVSTRRFRTGEFDPAELAADRRFAGPAEPLASPASRPDAGAAGEPTTAERISLFSIEIDRLTRTAAAERVLGWVERTGRPTQVVVTPNVQHVVMLSKRADLRAVYADADLILADGMPVVATARLAGKRLPERVTGSDLVPAIFDVADRASGVGQRFDRERPLRVFLLGAGPGVAEVAATAIERRWDAVAVAGTASPPRGFEDDPAETERLIAAVGAARPDVLLVGLGAPKQELWVHAHRDRLAADVTLCIGATIDFLAGNVRRAPRWMQRTGTEWLYRIAREPRRLAGRYAGDAVAFPPPGDCRNRPESAHSQGRMKKRTGRGGQPVRSKISASDAQRGQNPR